MRAFPCWFNLKITYNLVIECNQELQILSNMVIYSLSIFRIWRRAWLEVLEKKNRKRIQFDPYETQNPMKLAIVLGNFQTAETKESLFSLTKFLFLFLPHSFFLPLFKSLSFSSKRFFLLLHKSVFLSSLFFLIIFLSLSKSLPFFPPTLFVFHSSLAKSLLSLLPTFFCHYTNLSFFLLHSFLSLLKTTLSFFFFYTLFLSLHKSLFLFFLHPFLSILITTYISFSSFFSCYLSLLFTLRLQCSFYLSQTPPTPIFFFLKSYTCYFFPSLLPALHISISIYLSIYHMQFIYANMLMSRLKSTWPIKIDFVEVPDLCQVYLSFSSILLSLITQVFFLFLIIQVSLFICTLFSHCSFFFLSSSLFFSLYTCLSFIFFYLFFSHCTSHSFFYSSSHIIQASLSFSSPLFFSHYTSLISFSFNLFFFIIQHSLSFSSTHYSLITQISHFFFYSFPLITKLFLSFHFTHYACFFFSLPMSLLHFLLHLLLLP
ncbi:NPEPPS [Acanthosepion pharaonis]|uniref:NPEPPS n=1 Tax=Acanthosepion pharaonis TaxID=158019 RepID=A0A812EB90_ACAPH|nr:NPEPPS [Sepia pharaonis]